VHRIQARSQYHQNMIELPYIPQSRMLSEPAVPSCLRKRCT